MANEWNTHLDSLKDRLSELNQTVDDIKSKVEKRPGLDAATQSIAGLISETSDKSLNQYPVVLSNVLSDSAIGAIMLNAEGKFMMFNFTAQRILGIAYVSRMSGAGDMERQEEPASFLRADDSYFEERELPWKRVLDGVAVNNFRLKVKKDAISDVRWINISAVPFINGPNNTPGVSGGVVFLFDFTDEVNLETSINTLCSVIAGQISQVGNSQRELEQLANQLAQTGIQKILLDKGITQTPSPQARAPEPDIAVAPVPDLSQRARFQPEIAREREVVEERKKSEETPEVLIDKLASAAIEPQESIISEIAEPVAVKDNNGSHVQDIKDESDEDIAPWPEEADAEDFNKPLWEEYGKGEEEAAQSWTKNLDAVVSEVIEESRETKEESEISIDEDDNDDGNEVEIEEDEDHIDTQPVELEEIESGAEIESRAENEEIELEVIDEVHGEAEVVEEVEEIPQIEPTLEAPPQEEPVLEFETEAETQIEETQVQAAPEAVFPQDEEPQLDTGSFGRYQQEEQESQPAESEPNIQDEIIQSESSHVQIGNEFDEFEPIDQILSFSDDEKPAEEPVVIDQEEEQSAPVLEFAQDSQFPELPLPIVQNLVDEAFEPISEAQDFQAPPPTPFQQPDMPAAIQQSSADTPEPEDFSDVQSLVQKPSLKDTLLGGKKKRNTSSSMHRIRAMGGATELGAEALDSDSEQTVEYTADEEADLNIKKVLVVDDIPVNQKLLLLHLRRLGYDADVASNGQEALDALADKEYELILMDCDMPVMNGFEAAARIRSNESYSHRRIPIIALTSYDREGDRERCIAAGMDDYITKGASRKELKEAIKRSVVSAREKGQSQSSEFNLDDIQADIAPLDIKAMLKLYGKEEVEEISRLFLSNMGTYIECMQLAIDEKDADSVVHFANAVKGPCAALGMKLMTRLTTDIIQYSEAKDWTQVRVKYMRLKAVFVQTREELKKVCPDDSLLAK